MKFAASTVCAISGIPTTRLTVRRRFPRGNTYWTACYRGKVPNPILIWFPYISKASLKLWTIYARIGLSQALVERTAEHAVFRLDEHMLYTQVAYYLLSFGGKIRIIGPEELKSGMIDIAESLLKYYQS